VGLVHVDEMLLHVFAWGGGMAVSVSVLIGGCGFFLWFVCLLFGCFGGGFFPILPDIPQLENPDHNSEILV
jgi:hypothetical protein